jgi:hypothetical protein
VRSIGAQAGASALPGRPSSHAVGPADPVAARRTG